MNENKQKIIYTLAMLFIFLVIANTMVEVNWALQVLAVLFAAYYIYMAYREIKKNKDKNEPD
ncbi:MULTISPECIES: hypothetical protein [Jeotgalicoccus]|uniref:hypothetical protein n=1 Tax=Jeotgalicoccus TaxID=227979 RepID=UPI0004111307|nr:MULTISPECIES: hypothetical protein [Jeotgalicoccus]QQD85007.1 hypothetical protein JEM45_10480 [Jeotgalicoccus sp. ATCC 8456]